MLGAVERNNHSNTDILQQAGYQEKFQLLGQDSSLRPVSPSMKSKGFKKNSDLLSVACGELDTLLKF